MSVYNGSPWYLSYKKMHAFLSGVVIRTLNEGGTGLKAVRGGNVSISHLLAVLQNSQSKGHARLLLLEIATFTDKETGVAYPSKRTLSRVCGLSQRTIEELLRKLKKSAELEISIGTGPAGCNEYRITLKDPLAPHTAGLAKIAKGMKSPLSKKPSTPPSKICHPILLKDDPDFSEIPEADKARLLIRAGVTPGSLAWKELMSSNGDSPHGSPTVP